MERIGADWEGGFLARADAMEVSVSNSEKRFVKQAVRLKPG